MSSKSPPLWGELARLQERLHHLFEQALSGVGEELQQEGAVGSWRPPLDLVESGDVFALFVELPGVRRDEIELEIQGRWLELSGHRKMREGDPSFLRLEGRYGPFRRRVELAEEVDPDGVTARLRRGVLEVRLPKRHPSGAGRVEIRGGEEGGETRGPR